MKRYLMTLALTVSGISTAAPLTVTEEQSMNFGAAFPGSKSCALDFDGSLSGDCFGQGIAGLIRITGDPNTSLNVGVNKPGWNGNIRLRPELLHKRRFAYITDSSGELLIPVAGSLQMRGNVNGPQTLQYVITVFYQ